jgi:neutral ceramidase
MIEIGIAQTDITPTEPVWLVGYGNRDHKSEGVYQPLRAGALYLCGSEDAALIITADLIGYDLAFAAESKALIGDATGLLPRQIILTATHTHCAPFFYPWNMPGQPEPTYAAFLKKKLIEVSSAALACAQQGQIAFARGSSSFGVNRRKPNGDGGVVFAPHPDGAMDRDLDTLWCSDAQGRPLASLTIFGCHPTSLGGYLIGGDYPGYLCRALEDETGVPALFATGCAGNIRPWYKGTDGDFARPSLDELAAAGRTLAAEVLATHDGAQAVDASNLHTTSEFHSLPYVDLPTAAMLEAAAREKDVRRRDWAQTMLEQLEHGPLPSACPQEVQLLRFNDDLLAVFLGGEVLTEIGQHIKLALHPATTITAAYANGLITYVPSEEAYPLGGYEVDGSYHLFIRPAPFVKEVEERIVAFVEAQVQHLSYRA